MNERAPHRILVATEPAVLEGALALLLRARRATEVVEYHAAAECDRSSPYDAAIVTIDLRGDVRADVVLTLPGVAGDRAVGHVSTGDVDREVDVRSQRQVLDLFDELFPAGPATRRAEGGGSG